MNLKLLFTVTQEHLAYLTFVRSLENSIDKEHQF